MIGIDREFYVIKVLNKGYLEKYDFEYVNLKTHDVKIDIQFTRDICKAETFGDKYDALKYADIVDRALDSKRCEIVFCRYITEAEIRYMMKLEHEKFLKKRNNYMNDERNKNEI